MDNLVAYTRSYSPWHSIGYLVADHDEPTRDGCSFADELSSIYEDGGPPAEARL